MRASIVIVTFNHRAHIPRCLDALLPTLGGDDEVIVVDNASGDGTADVVARRAPAVRLVRCQTNRGFGPACNLAARSSEAGYLVFLNPDTEPRAGWLDALLGGLERSGAGLATAKLLLTADPTRIDAFGNDLHISGIPTCRAWGEPAAAHATIEEVAAVSGACFAIRRDLFGRLGGFDERLFLYYEDDDLSLRARLAGWTIVAVPDALVLHDHRPGVGATKLRYLERNRWWSLLKVYRPLTLLRLLPVLLLAEMMAWGLAFMSGPVHVAAKTRAWCDVIGWLPGLSSARPAMRQVSDAELARLHTTRLPFAQVSSGPLARTAERASAVLFALLDAR